MNNEQSNKINRKKILIVDDEPNIIEVLKVYAEVEGFEVYSALDGMEAVEETRKIDFSLIIMDIMMPRLDGVTAARTIRKFSNAPILFLSAKSEESDKITGFENGADDYVTKPFSPREVMLRVKSILRRSEITASMGSSLETGLDNIPIDDELLNAEQPKKEILVFGDDRGTGGLKIDVSGHEVFVDNKSVSLTPKEFELLHYLMRNRGFALSRAQLLEKVWGFDFYGDDRTVDTHVKMLRSHIGKYKKYILTVRSIGYKFDL